MQSNNNNFCYRYSYCCLSCYIFILKKWSACCCMQYISLLIIIGVGVDGDVAGVNVGLCHASSSAAFSKRALPLLKCKIYTHINATVSWIHSNTSFFSLALSFAGQIALQFTCIAFANYTAAWLLKSFLSQFRWFKILVFSYCSFFAELSQKERRLLSTCFFYSFYCSSISVIF